MNWQQWLRDWGLPVSYSPDTTSIGLAATLVVTAFWIGWVLGRRMALELAHYFVG